MPDNLRVADVIPAPPRAVYDAWLDAKKHTLMTGAKATDEGKGRFTAWNGYISGRTLEKQPQKKIVQSWRTSHFSDTDADSKVTVELEPFDGGTHVTLVQENIPDEQADSYRDGWHQHYFAPMKAFFAAKKTVKPKAKNKKAVKRKTTAKKSAPKKSPAKKSPARKKKR